MSFSFVLNAAQAAILTYELDWIKPTRLYMRAELERRQEISREYTGLAERRMWDHLC